MKVFQTYQRYNFESKSQHAITPRLDDARCFRPIKDTILRANHNYRLLGISLCEVFQTYQRYNFESKSQHSRHVSFYTPWCFRPIKDTILRANHNGNQPSLPRCQVFQTYQRYNFESKSQQGSYCLHCDSWCFRPIKDTILRANHNCCTGR